MGLNQEMPQTIRGMRTRLGQLQTLLVSLDSIHPSILCGFRFEFVMYAKASINQCHELIHDFPMTDGVPDGVVIKQQIDIEDYITQLRNTVADAIAAGFNVGRDANKPRTTLNAVGYHNPKWVCLLNDDKELKMQEEVRVNIDEDDNDEILLDMLKRVVTRNPPKAPHLLSGILANGGITKGFPTRLELCKHLFGIYGSRWDKNVMHTNQQGDKKMPNKRKNCAAPDIQGKANFIGQVSMGKELYAAYDMPHDGSCFYHAYSDMIRPHLGSETHHHGP